MNINDQFKDFKRAIIHPRVATFILLGAAVMLLTFFVNNNAVEIAISGIASIFIGIGVNNLSSLETHLEDERQLERKLGHVSKILGIIYLRITAVHSKVSANNCQETKLELQELKQILYVSMSLIRDEETLE